MRIYKTIRYRVYPTDAQADRLGRWEEALRFLWNLANEQRVLWGSRPRDERRIPSFFAQNKELTELRRSLSWLKDVPRNVSAQMLLKLSVAWQRYLMRIGGRPRWKRRGHDCISLCETSPTQWRVEGGSIRFPKLGALRAALHRPLEGAPKTCTLWRDGGQWFVSISCEIEIADPAPRTDPVVAIDRGVTNTIATSDGDLVAAPRHLEAATKRLARAQRTVSRRKKGSKNREKAKARVAVLHRKVRRQREHFLHELTTKIAKSHGIVVVEKLQIANMSRSAAGTVEKPGKGVRQKAGLNRAILTAGWGRMVTMLKYKLAWSGGTLIEVPAHYSSQTCSSCGCVDARSRRSQAAFRCTGCGHEENADINAAKVLLTRANRSGLPVEGDGSRRSRKRTSPFAKNGPAETTGNATRWDFSFETTAKGRVELGEM